MTEVNPRGPYTVHQYLVDFREHDNSRVGIPWQSQWFREEWLSLVERRPAEAGAAEGGRDATGHDVATHQANQPPNVPAVEEPPIVGVRPESRSVAEPLDELVSYAWSAEVDVTAEYETGADVEDETPSVARRRLRIRSASVESGSSRLSREPPAGPEPVRTASASARPTPAGSSDTLGPLPSGYGSAAEPASGAVGKTDPPRADDQDDTPDK